MIQTNMTQNNTDQSNDGLVAGNVTNISIGSITFNTDLSSGDGKKRGEDAALTYSTANDERKPDPRPRSSCVTKKVLILCVAIAVAFVLGIAFAAVIMLHA